VYSIMRSEKVRRKTIRKSVRRKAPASKRVKRSRIKKTKKTKRTKRKPNKNRRAYIKKTHKNKSRSRKNKRQEGGRYSKVVTAQVRPPKKRNTMPYNKLSLTWTIIGDNCVGIEKSGYGGNEYLHRKGGYEADRPPGITVGYSDQIKDKTITIQLQVDHEPGEIITIPPKTPWKKKSNISLGSKWCKPQGGTVLIAGSEVRHTTHFAKPWERIGKMRTTFELTIDLKAVEQTLSKWFSWAPYIYLPLNSIRKTTDELDKDYGNTLWNKAGEVLQESSERFSAIQAKKTEEVYEHGRPFRGKPLKELQKIALSVSVEAPDPDPEITPGKVLQGKIQAAMQEKDIDKVRELMAERATAMSTAGGTATDIKNRIERMTQKELLDLIKENLSEDTCTICNEVITAPFVTPCRHIFCRDCIGKYGEKEAVPAESFDDRRVSALAIEGKMQCPLCRVVFRLPQFGEAPQKVKQVGDDDANARPWHGGSPPIPHIPHRVLLTSGRVSWTEIYGIYFKKVKQTEIDMDILIGTLVENAREYQKKFKGLGNEADERYWPATPSDSDPRVAPVPWGADPDDIHWSATPSGSDPQVASEEDDRLNMDMTRTAGSSIAGAGAGGAGAGGGAHVSSMEVPESTREVSEAPIEASEESVEAPDSSINVTPA
jgi:hypothetical protein